MSGLTLTVRPDGTLAVRGNVPMRADGTPDSPYTPIYGPGGLFGICGQHPQLFNATVGPIGVERILTWVGSDELSPIYSALTEVTSTGYAQSGDCDDCGKPNFRRCSQSACFGRICQETWEHAVDRLGMVANQGVQRLALFGDITDPAGNVLLPRGQPITDAFTLELIGAAYNVRRRLGELMWTGNPVNNLGGYEEFPGLIQIINTGKVDVLSGLACDAMDSYIRSFGNNVIGAAGSPSILGYIAGAIRSIHYRIAGAHMDPTTAQIYLVMHPRLWDCVANAAACEYGLVCNVGATSYNNAMEVAERRDDMIRGSYLRVDGREYPVVLDNSMPSSIGYLGDDTMFCGDIAILTTSVDGQTILWGEYQDLNKTLNKVLAWLRSMFGAQPFAITDGGRFLYTYDVAHGLCLDARVLSKIRIKCTMPWLQARLTDVCCLPNGSYPDVTGSGGLYELGGGATTSPTISLYGECGDQQPR